MNSFSSQAIAFAEDCLQWPIGASTMELVGNEIVERSPPLHPEEMDPYHFKVWSGKGSSPKHVYAAGVHVAEGLGGEADYSCISVVRVDRELIEQEACFRSNTTDPITLAAFCNHIGRQCNNALLAVDDAQFQSTAAFLLTRYKYPNIFSWKSGEGTTGIMKTHMAKVMEQSLLDHTFIPRSINLVRQMAGKSPHRDELKATMIAVCIAEHSQHWMPSQECSALS